MNKSVMRLLAFPLFIGVIYSCQSEKTGKSPDPASAAIIKAMDTATIADLESPLIDSNFKSFPVDYRNDSVPFPATVLTTGQFHSDEVSKEDVKRHWYGLFLNKDGYYLDSTGIITKRVEDAIDDDEGQKTGWEVKTTNTDTSLLLFAGVDGLSKRKIVPVELSKQEVLPGEKVSFTYNGIVYTLYASGNKKKDPHSTDYYIINYQLFIKAVINGAERRQLLVNIGELWDPMVQVLFAGDIDGDTIPDLIIETAGQENVEAPTLYLSKPAGKTQLLKVMGLHVSVGC